MITHHAQPVAVLSPRSLHSAGQSARSTRIDATRWQDRLMRNVMAVVSEEAWEALDAAAAAKGCTIEELAKGVLETASVRLRAAGAPFDQPQAGRGPRSAVGPDGRIGP